MLRQDDRKLNMIERFGCYFLSLGKIAEEVTGIELTPKQIYHVMASCIHHMDMGADMYVKDPAMIVERYLDELGKPRQVLYAGYWNEDMDREVMWVPKYTHVIERWEYGIIYHFKLPDWDPHPGLELGKLTGKRYLKVL